MRRGRRRRQGLVWYLGCITSAGANKFLGPPSAFRRRAMRVIVLNASIVRVQIHAAVVVTR